MPFQDVCFLTSIYLLLLLSGIWCSREFLLQSRLGMIKGIQNEHKMVYQFRGIPYGKPPTGDLRFGKPQPYGSWNDTLDGTHFPPSCMQFKTPAFRYLPSDRVSEDCLYLNIYVPGEINRDNLKSVMVWIHGGGFVFGQATAYDGSELASQGDVIVATVNYRLGVFGFLSSADSVLPGNYGLWDQRLAIKWVKDNIADFGGNPSLITLFGATAGGMCASLQALSPLNSGLFQRAIFQSGIALSELSIIKCSNLEYFGTRYNCSNTISSEIVRCLRQLPADELTQNSISFHHDSINTILGPIIDGELIPDDPEKLLSNPASPSYKIFRSIDIIIGTTSAEGSVLVMNADPFNLDNREGMTSTDLCDVITPAIAKDVYNNSSSVKNSICNKYKVTEDGDHVKEKQGMQIVNLYTDLYFLSPAVEVLNAHSKTNEITHSYQYYFTTDLPSTPVPSWLNGAIHGADVKFVFGVAGWAEQRNITLNSNELGLSQNVIQYWTNFAKTGNPNGGSLSSWPTYKYKDKKYLEFGEDGMTREKAMLKADEMKFWFNLNGKSYLQETSMAATFHTDLLFLILRAFLLLVTNSFFST